MARGYRAILELEGAESAMQTADRLFHEWVNKKYPPGGSREGVECDAEGIYRTRPKNPTTTRCCGSR